MNTTQSRARMKAPHVTIIAGLVAALLGLVLLVATKPTEEHMTLFLLPGFFLLFLGTGGVLLKSLKGVTYNRWGREVRLKEKPVYFSFLFLMWLLVCPFLAWVCWIFAGGPSLHG